MAATANRRHQRARTVAMLSAALASGGIWSSFSHADTTYTYTGTGGTTAAPTSDNFSTGFGGTAPVSSTTTELDFLDTGSPSGYTATDDLGGFTLDALTLGNNTSNTDTIAGTSGSSLIFSGASTTIAQNGSGAFVISDTIGIDPHNTLTFGGTGIGLVTVSGSIGGGGGNSVTVAGASTMAGVNTVIFSGSNTYSGALNVNSGILNVQNSSAISSSQGYINSGATLQLQNNITESANLQLNGNGAAGQNGVLVNSSGTNTITGNVGFSGNATVSSDSGTIIFAGAFSDSNVLTLTGAGNGVFQGYLGVDAHAGFNLSGTGTWFFDTTNVNFQASVHLNSGTLEFVKGGLSGLYVSPYGGVLQYAPDTSNPDDLSNDIGYGSGSSPIAIDTNGNDVTFANSFGGVNDNGGLIKYGLGTLTLTAGAAYGGSTSVAGGTLQIGNGTSGSLPGGSAITISNGAVLGVDSSTGTNMNNAIANAGTVLGDQGSGITNTLSGNITGAGGVLQSGNGTLVLSGQNNYTGTTAINSGTLQAGSTAALGSPSAVILANAANTALNIADYNNTIGSLAGGGTLGGNVVLGTSTSTQLTIGSDNTNTTFAGAIVGAGIINKTGTGTLTLTGSSSFTGGGNVISGILNLQNSSAFGSSATGGALTVASGATLQLQGGITLPGYPIQIADSGTLPQDGAIVNVSGTNTINSPIIISGNNAGLTTIASDSGTLIIAGGISSNPNNVSLSGAGTGVIANSGSVNFAGSNFVAKDGSGSWDFTNTAIAFAGNLHLDSGTLSFVTGGLGGTTINANGGVLKYDTGNTQDVSGVGGGNPTIQYGNGPIEVDTNGHTITWNGTLSNNNGSRGLVKYGAGALILTNNTVYGDNNTTVTSVLGGTLVVNGSTPGGANGQYGSTTTVGDGVNANTGVLAGTGTIGSSLTVQLGGTITAGSGATPSDTLGTLHLSGVTFNNGGTYAVKIGASGTSDELMTPYYTGPQGGPFVIQVTGTGSATFATGEQWVIANNSSGNNPFDKTTFVITSVGAPPASDFSVDNVADGSGYDLVLTADSTPEPTTALIIVPFAAMMLGRRRRRSV